MKKTTTTAQPDVWNEDITEQDPINDFTEQDLEINSVEDLKPQAPTNNSMEYSLAGLQADFPTAKDLEQFVFDETHVSLKLKGLDPERKYELALAVLCGQDIDSKYITGANPYIDSKEMIPQDPLKAIPARDPRLTNDEPMSIYHDFNIPHPNRDMRAQDAKVICQFKTYSDGSISYEIMGPLERHAVGEKLDKYGRSRPEKIEWIDPRTGEQAIRYRDGSYSKMGQRLRTLMEAKRVNKGQSIWSVWIDRNFTQFNQSSIENPWET
jgi:hypothetical protein